MGWRVGWLVNVTFTQYLTKHGNQDKVCVQKSHDSKKTTRQVSRELYMEILPDNILKVIFAFCDKCL